MLVICNQCEFYNSGECDGSNNYVSTLEDCCENYEPARKYRCDTCFYYNKDNEFCKQRRIYIDKESTWSFGCVGYSKDNTPKDFYEEESTEVSNTNHDPVNHPNHYTSGGIECIDCIKAALGENFIGFLIGNVIKYCYRYRNKNGIEDLKKSKWYLEKAIKELEEQEYNK